MKQNSIAIEMAYLFWIVAMMVAGIVAVVTENDTLILFMIGSAILYHAQRK